MMRFGQFVERANYCIGLFIVQCQMFNVHCISVLNFVILKGFLRFKSSGRAAREDNLMRGKKLISPHGGLVPILASVPPASNLS